MSLHPGTTRDNLAGNSDFTRKAEALALGIANWSTPKATDGAKGGPGQSYGSGGMPPLPAQAAKWQTPAARNWKGSSPARVTLGLDFCRPGSPAQGVQAVPVESEDADQRDQTDDAQDRPRDVEDQS